MLNFQKMMPVNSEDLVLSSKCENSDSSLNKEHLLFSFIPSKYIYTPLPSSLIAYPFLIHILLFLSEKQECNQQSLKFVEECAIVTYQPFCISFLQLTRTFILISAHILMKQDLISALRWWMNQL